MQTLRRSKIGMLFVLGLIALCLLPSMKAHALSGGLLDGKAGYVHAPAWNGTHGTSPKGATDNNYSTNVWVPYNNGNYLQFTLDSPANITSYSLSVSGSGTTYVNLYNPSNQVVSSVRRATGTFTVNVANVSYVRLINTDNGNSIYINEFDMFGEFGPPDAPTGLKATPSRGGIVDLAWNAITNATYSVYLDGVKIASGLTSASYTAAELLNNVSYRWTVTASFRDAESQHSSPVTSLWDTVEPNKPTGLTATNPASNQILLKWQANTEPDVIGYNVYQNDSRINTGLVSGTSYLVSGLTNGQNNTYEVTAVDDNGNESVKSNAITAASSDMTPPDPVAGFTGSGSDGAVTLRWTKNTESDLKGYKLFMDGVLVKILTGDVLTHTQTGLTNGTAYAFSILAYDVSGNESNKVTATIKPVDTTPPVAPINLVAAAGNRVVNLYWTANKEKDLKGYFIYQNGFKINTTPTTDIVRIVSSLTNGTAYRFTISAVDMSGNESAQSAEITATPNISSDVTPPNAPTGLTGVGDVTTIDLSWKKNTEIDLIGYFVYLDGVRMNYAPISANVFNLYNLKRGNTYAITITAIDSSGNESEKSNIVTVKLPLFPAPKALKAKGMEASILLSWQPNDPAPEKYFIYRDGVRIGETSETQFDDPDVEVSKGYKYEVSAFQEEVESDKSKVSIFYTKSSLDFDETNKDKGFTVQDVIQTAWNFITKYGLYIVLLLAVIFSSTILSALIWLFKKMKPPKQKERKKRAPLTEEEKAHRAEQRAAKRAAEIKASTSDRVIVNDRSELDKFSKKLRTDREVKVWTSGRGKKSSSRANAARGSRSAGKTTRTISTGRSTRSSRSGRSGRNGRS